MADWSSIRSIATRLHGLENEINAQRRMSQEPQKTVRELAEG
jgi:hypothetical protein